MHRSRPALLGIRLVALCALFALPVLAVRAVSAAPPPPARRSPDRLRQERGWRRARPTSPTARPRASSTTRSSARSTTWLPHPTNAEHPPPGSSVARRHLARHERNWQLRADVDQDVTLGYRGAGHRCARVRPDRRHEQPHAGRLRLLQQLHATSGRALDGLLLSTDNGVTWTPIVDPLLTGENNSGVAVRGNILVAASNSFGWQLHGQLGGSYAAPTARTTWTHDLRRPRHGASERATSRTWSATPRAPRASTPTCSRTASTAATTPARRGPVRSPTTAVRCRPKRPLAALARTLFFAAPPGRDLPEQPRDGGLPHHGAPLDPASMSGGQPNVDRLQRRRGHGRERPAPPGPRWICPLTGEVAGGVGLAPRAKAGAQGAVHALDRRGSERRRHLSTVGGDRQPSSVHRTTSARTDFSGRLFRCRRVRPMANGAGRSDSTQPDALYSTQWRHITHTDPTVFVILPCLRVAQLGRRRHGQHNSAPHADSRDMAFDANGCLIEGDDGGVYANTNPSSSAGTWLSLMGTNLQVTEAHDVAYDTVSDFIFSGHQDTGTAVSRRPRARSPTPRSRRCSTSRERTFSRPTAAT